MQLVTLSSLELAKSSVERGADGLPRGWPIFRVGDNFLTASGAPANLKLSGDDLKHIAEYHKRKGVKIPIDCAHVISKLAKKIDVDESEITRRLPRIVGVAGFADLVYRDGALELGESAPAAKPATRRGWSGRSAAYTSPEVRSNRWNWTASTPRGW